MKYLSRNLKNCKVIYTSNWKRKTITLLFWVRGSNVRWLQSSYLLNFLPRNLFLFASLFPSLYLFLFASFLLFTSFSLPLYCLLFASLFPSLYLFILFSLPLSRLLFTSFSPSLYLFLSFSLPLSHFFFFSIPHSRIF